MKETSIEIYTIGHSTHSRDEFLEILKHYNIKALVDVRSFPGSKYVPHFNKENMKVWLKKYEIKYIHMPKLGGRRHQNRNIDIAFIEGWKHVSFRNYAAYTLTDEFENELNILIEMAKRSKLCIMCAESVPWKCHRLLISNCLYVKNVHVFHILSKSNFIQHELNKFGAKTKFCGKRIIYPKE